MKGKQMKMTSVMEEIDRYELEREKRETRRIMDSLDEKYGRSDEKALLKKPDGCVVIIGQYLFRNEHYTWHFYRTVMTFSYTKSRGKYSIFVQANNEEWPDVPPWAQVVNHENEPRDIDYYRDHIHWATDEVVEPIRTWWQKRWEDY